MAKASIRRAGAILSLALVLAGHSAAAPPDRMITVGVLSSGPPQRWALIEVALVEGLAALGYVEGKNLVMSTDRQRCEAARAAGRAADPA